MTTARKRYPGPQPFSPEDKDLFFGREEDVKALKRMINLRPTTTLHGQSGLGKTSLLNTKVLPHFEAAGYQIIRVRFGNYQGANSDFPPSVLANSLPEAALQESFLHQIEGEYPSLWQQCKTMQVNALQSDQHFEGILFVFDQFEELFTYPKGADMVADQLEKLLNDSQPRTFQRKKNQILRSKPDLLNKEEWELLETPLTVKVLFSLRSDRMSLMDRLSDQLPSILRYCYELQPFTEAQARNTIVKPAALNQEGFASPPFAYSEEAVAHLLRFLTNDGSQSVDPFQIQLICPTIEEQIISAPPTGSKAELPTVQKEDLPELADLYRDYYLRSLNKLPEDRQKPSRLLIEEGLILPDVQRRISVDGRQLKSQFKVDDELLRALVDQRLLRSDRNQHGAYNYEVSHDSLVVPILQQRKERVEKENLNAFFKKIGLYFIIAAGIFILGFAIWVVRLNSELREINHQLLSAFNQMGWTFAEERDSLKDESPIVRTIDLTNEIGSARRALVDAQGKLSNFQSKTRELERQLNDGEITQEDYIKFFQEHQTELAELLQAPGIAQMSSSNIFLPLPEDASAAEIRDRVERFYVEAARLGEQKKYNDAIHKYDQILHWFPREKRAQDSLQAINLRLNPPVPEASRNAVDTDQDGIPDRQDKCATVPGLKELDGCPDTDGDKIPDNVDNCPEEAGTEEFNGCPPEVAGLDTDGDGIFDVEDRCKNEAGLAEFAGCPDLDEDGVPDPDDLCPEVAGDPEKSGCPDLDGDGVVGEMDKCPEVAGKPELGGCLDEDGDRIVGTEDHCPDDFGTEENNGCPEEADDPDPDGDGVLAEQDRCPDEKGINHPNFQGCLPEIKWPKVVKVEGGSFERTNKFGKNAHTVQVSTFWIGQYEITFEEFLPFLIEAKGFQAKSNSSILDRLKQPAADKVTWKEANEFCKWLSKKDPNHNYRLPTEAEWEYAARGGNKDAGYQYAGSNNISEVAWYKDGNQTKDWKRAKYEVGKKKPNALGIYDMSGGVAEWCSDWFIVPDSKEKEDAYYQFAIEGKPIVNPQGPGKSESSGLKSLRGGSYKNPSANCKINNQYGNKPNIPTYNFGFRVVRY